MEAKDVAEILAPAVFSWAKALLVDGRDPKAELEAMLASADAAADAAERAKFGGE